MHWCIPIDSALDRQPGKLPDSCSKNHQAMHVRGLRALNVLKGATRGTDARRGPVQATHVHAEACPAWRASWGAVVVVMDAILVVLICV